MYININQRTSIGSGEIREMDGSSWRGGVTVECLCDCEGLGCLWRVAHNTIRQYLVISYFLWYCTTILLPLSWSNTNNVNGLVLPSAWTQTGAAWRSSFRPRLWPSKYVTTNGWREHWTNGWTGTRWRSSQQMTRHDRGSGRYPITTPGYSSYYPFPAFYCSSSSFLLSPLPPLPPLNLRNPRPKPG